MSEEVEDKVRQCADDHEIVNATLKPGISALERIEDVLAKTRTKLADTEHALAVALEGEREARLEVA